MVNTKLPQLPQTPLIFMSKGVTLIIDDALYKIDEEGEADDNFLQLIDAKFPLVELEKIGKLEELYFKDQADKINAWKSAYQKINERPFNAKLAEDEVETQLLEFIIEKVFPYFVEVGKKPKLTTSPETSTKKKILTAEEISQAKNSTNPLLSKLLKKTGAKRESFLQTQKDEEPADKKSGRPAKKSSTPANSIFVESAARSNLVIIEDAVYGLKSMLPQNNDLMLSFNRQIYTLLPLMDFLKLKQLYQEAITMRLKKEAELEHPRIKEIAVKKGSLEQEVQRDIYRNAGLSLVKENYYAYWVCLDVPEYVNIGDDDHLYRFPENKVAVKITFGKGRGISSPVIVHASSFYNIIEDGKIVGKESKKIPYRHPFLRGVSDFNTICTNNYAVSDKLTDEQKVVKLLNVAKNTMMSGYFGELRPYNRLVSSSEFEVMRIKKHNVEEFGLQITNKKRGE